jgi:hypothetical protein
MKPLQKATILAFDASPGNGMLGLGMFCEDRENA